MGFPYHDERAGAMSIVARLKRDRSKAQNERGVALLIVLWIFIFLFVVAFNFSANVRDEADAAHRFSDDTQGYYLAVAGFQRGLYEYLMQAQGKEPQQQQQQQQQKENAAGFFDGSWREENLGSGISRVRLIDEGGKINLNRVDENLLRRVFTNLSIEEPLRSILVDSILDWIDSDDLHRANGAENDYYQSLSTPYTAKNGPFDSVEDLLWVRGVTSELFFGSQPESGAPATENRKVGLRQIFTIDSPIDRVNLRTAPAEVIHALLGIPLKKSQEFVEERKKLSEKTIADMLPLLGLTATDTALQMFVFTNPSVITVEAEGRDKDSRVPRRVKGVVRASAGAGRLELVRWVDRNDMPAED
jgi:general secretion pathway protein K